MRDSHHVSRFTLHASIKGVCMKIRFLGVGSAFTTPAYYQSNMLVRARSGKELLVDCGSDIRFSLSEFMRGDGRKTTDPDEDFSTAIDAVYISHLHSDHIGGMEWMAFRTYFAPNPAKPRLFMEENTMRDLWTHSLRGGLGRIEGKLMHLTDYFDCCPVPENGSFCWENIRFTLVRMPHIMTGFKDFYSHGLLLREAEGPPIFISTDTQFRSDIIVPMSGRAEIIFHDCETSPFKSIVHAHYDDLRTLPAAVRRKMWLYHYQPHPVRQPKADGFVGFVQKGQAFDFS